MELPVGPWKYMFIWSVQLFYFVLIPVSCSKRLCLKTCAFLWRKELLNMSPHTSWALFFVMETSILHLGSINSHGEVFLVGMMSQILGSVNHWQQMRGRSTHTAGIGWRLTVLRFKSKTENYCDWLSFQANEESRRFEGILKICKQVNPKLDVHNFVMSVSQEPVFYEPRLYIFNPPADPNIPGSEVSWSLSRIRYPFQCLQKVMIVPSRHGEHLLDIRPNETVCSGESRQSVSFPLSMNSPTLQSSVNAVFKSHFVSVIDTLGPTWCSSYWSSVLYILRHKWQT